jgi:hypothetical protein
MFGADDKDKRLPLTVTLTNGQVIKGSVTCGPAASLTTELNREGPFLTVKEQSGQQIYLAKSSILNVVEGDQKEERPAFLPDMPHGQSPHKTLHISEDASAEVARQSYLALAKMYHPDSYSEDTTAPEIREYASRMFQRINAAYAMIKDDLKAAA